MKLLLIHTGGTIGMAPGPDGLHPAPGLVEAALAARLPKGTDLVAEVFAPLRDSADVGPAEWNRILTLMADHPGRAVLLTHGTDTLAFTGAALDQALAGSGRRLVICGAMVPLGMGGDAEANLDLAVAALAEPDAGVFLALGGALLPAGGLAKIDSHAPDAFTALPQSAPVPRAPHPAPFDENKRLAILSLSPGLPAAMLEAALEVLDAAVLRVFGAGTMMSDPAIVSALARATARGCRIRAVSQCLRGGLEPGAYAAGAALWSAGVENGGLETAEAALARLWLDLSARAPHTIA
ncbi:asparaginase domain-containing protein [Gemmobacter sp. LW-1]|uniref:asparaginase domain-containing protein n=1 Tax=Gemmobacter sp. LW-1 TaxID=1529005 RepID=UPI0006C76B4F|nr:asparaginase domain-containing protein [Gemmobacter sp. LW-1]